MQTAIKLFTRIMGYILLGIALIISTYLTLKFYYLSSKLGLYVLNSIFGG